MFDSSRDKRMPRIVTRMAAVFVMAGMVMGRVLVGRILDVMRRPAMMLPSASREIGLMTVGVFSLMGVTGGIRGCPV